VVEKYKSIGRFKVGMHYIYIQPKRDPANQWLTITLKLTEEDVKKIIDDWEEGWKVPVKEHE